LPPGFNNKLNNPQGLRQLQGMLEYRRFEVATIRLPGCACIFSTGRLKSISGMAIPVKITAFREALNQHSSGCSDMIAFKIILVLTGIVVVICLSIAVICLLAISRENQLPDIEDIEAPRKSN
jgi:hypothetical protein